VQKELYIHTYINAYTYVHIHTHIHIHTYVGQSSGSDDELEYSAERAPVRADDSDAQHVRDADEQVYMYVCMRAQVDMRVNLYVDMYLHMQCLCYPNTLPCMIESCTSKYTCIRCVLKHMCTCCAGTI
jgi:hypothetical protein